MVNATTQRDPRIYEDRYNGHCLLFTNFNNLEIDEIGRIFGHFGDYLSIRRAGNQGGIHFVTYETYDEAKRAVDGLDGHPDIQLKVYRGKRTFNQRRNHANGYNNNRPRWPNARNDDRQRYDRRRLQDNTRKFDNHYRAQYCKSREECCDENREDKFMNYLLESSPCNGTSSGESRSEVVNDTGVRRENDDDKMSASSWDMVQSYIEFVQGNVQRSNDARPSGNVETIAATIYTEDSLEIKAENDEETMPDGTQESMVEIAGEIIVGNVDPKFDEAYLLHLFAKYEPIAISELVPLMPRVNTQYCHMYFKNHEVAGTVEKNFDKLCLAGRQIIVQRRRRLMATYLEHL